MAFALHPFGTVAADIDSGALDLATEPLEVSLHGASFTPTSAMTLTTDLSDELSDPSYTTKAVTSPAVEALGDRRYRFTAANSEWSALDPDARWIVLRTVAGRLVGWVDPGTLLSASGGKAVVDWTVAEILAGTANPNASAAARRLFAYLKARPDAGTSLRWVSGQHLGNAGAVSTGLSQWADIEAQTGERPGVMGLDLDAGYSGSYSQMIDAALAHSAAGGILTVSAHMRIPALGVDSDRWNDLDSAAQAHLNFENLTNTGHSDYQALHDRIEDRYGLLLGALKDADAATIERLLHEMTARGFWWSAANPTCTPELFQLLHRQIREHLWDDMGCHNLLAGYSPQDADPYGTDNNGRRARFCDPDNTDIVCPTVYTMTPSQKKSMLSDTFDRLPGLIHAVGEFGRPGSGASGAGPMDMRLWISLFKELPTVTYGMTWTGYRGWQDNLFSNEALNDPWVVNLDEVAL